MSVRKKLIIVCGFMLLLSGCGQQQAKQADQGQQAKQDIIIWTWDETFNVKAAKMAAEEYAETHDMVNITVETKEREEILSEVKNILSVKAYEKLPDIMLMEDYDAQDVLSKYQDEFVDLTEKLDADKFVEYKTKLCSKDGHLYGIPFDSGTTALFYRVDILEEAGFAEEDMQDLTWEEYIRIGEEIYEKTGIPMLTLDPTDMPLIRLIMQSCGSWYVKEDGITADIDQNETLRAALEIYQELLEKKLGMSVIGWDRFIAAFQQGEVATVLSGGWIMSSIMNVSEQSGLWRVASIPVLSDQPGAVAASNLGGSTWYVLKNSFHSEAATDFLVSMFGENDNFLDELIVEIGLIPSIKDASGLSNYSAAEAFFGGQQVTKLIMEMAARVPAVNYGSKTYEIENILEEEFQIFLTDGDLDGCLARAQRKAQAVAGE